MRYHAVKEKKIRKAEEEHQNEINFQEYQIIQRQNEEQTKTDMLKLNSLRTQYEEFDDTNAKQKLHATNPNKHILAMNELNHGYAVF